MLLRAAHVCFVCVLLGTFACASRLSVFYTRFKHVCSRCCTLSHVFPHTYYAQSHFTRICLVFHTFLDLSHVFVWCFTCVCFACCIYMCHSNVPLVSFTWALCVMHIRFLCDMLLCFSLSLVSTVCTRKSIICVSHRGSNPI